MAEKYQLKYCPEIRHNFWTCEQKLICTWYVQKGYKYEIIGAAKYKEGV